jgi:hypothetical protein
MRKKLLSEAQVRRFQSLASIKPLNEMDSSYSRDDEDKMEEAYGDEAHMKDDEPMEALYEEEDEDMDLDKDEDMGDADVELDEELVDQFMEAVKTIEQVADALGGAAGGDDMDMGGDDMDMDMGGDDAPMELDAGDEEEPEGDEEEMLQEALRGISYVPSQKEVVKLVAKRVAKRLQEAKRADARLKKALGKK